MRVRKVGFAVAGLAIGLSIFGGCSSKYSSDDLKKELTTGSNAMTQDQANCIVDGLVAKGVPLDKYKDPTTEDQQKITAVVTDCVMKSAGVTPTTGSNQ